MPSPPQDQRNARIEDLVRAILAYVTGLRSARRRPLHRSEICAWFNSAAPADVNAALDQLIADGRLRLTKRTKDP